MSKKMTIKTRNPLIQLNKQVAYLDYLMVGLENITNSPAPNVMLEYYAYDAYFPLMKTQMYEITSLLDELIKYSESSQEDLIQGELIITK